MRAAYFETTGDPTAIRVGELPTPEPKAGEVRVRIHVAGVNPIDTYIRSGAVAMNAPKPFITGSDLAGIVESVGPGATRFKPGDRVWGTNQGLLGRQGTFAEYGCPNEDFLYAVPEGVSFEATAAVALVGITAHLGLFLCGNLKSGETVFVNGGTGGVGSCVVQMAKAVGAKVITTVGSADKASTARQLGADGVINYKTEDVPARVKELTGGKGVQLWYETLREPNYDRTVELMAPRGRIVVMAGRTARPEFPHGPFYVKCLSLHGFAMFNIPPAEQRHCADDINRWMVEGKLKPLIGKRLTLDDAVEAHRLQEDNTVRSAGTLSGKIVVTI